MSLLAKSNATDGNRRLNVLSRDYRPAYVVWELTLRCDLACTHCGSRAGHGRPDELTTDQALAVVADLADLGTDEVVLIGGEAYLHQGFLDVVAALRDAGIFPALTTGGRGITADLARDMARAGMKRVSLSIDGMRERHDVMRAWGGSFDAATEALRHCRDAGMVVTANTNLNRSNMSDLEPLYEHLRAQGVLAWQIQLTAPLGRAADRTDMLLQPWDLLDLVPRIEQLKRRANVDGVRIMPGNNLGYFGPEESLLRSPTPDHNDHWQGCQAGKWVMGIESDGAVKGCPSLQTKNYVGGNLKEQSLESLWRDDTTPIGFSRKRSVDDLWGFCRKCDFADPCLGGCTFTAHSILGRPGNNPYCHYRARHFHKRGLRERLVPTSAAAGDPFDHGLFDLVVEAFDAPEPRLAATAAPGDLVQITRRPKPTL